MFSLRYGLNFEMIFLCASCLKGLSPALGDDKSESEAWTVVCVQGYAILILRRKYTTFCV
jgi:hypothetical protein